MKRIISLILSVIISDLLAACSDIPSSAVGSTEGSSISEKTVTSSETEGESKDDTSAAARDVDYDLTLMSIDMEYAVIYQMMSNAEDFIGKTVRMDGLFYSFYYEGTGKTYYYCLIQDATACCAQGFEFELAGGEETGVEEYSAVTVQGVFETYEEEGYIYCRLGEAVVSAMG